MSVQSFLLNSLIRGSIKSPAVMGLFKNRAVPADLGIAGARPMIDDLIARYARTPSFVDIRHVNAGGVDAEWVRLPKSDKSKVLVYLHGGAYFFGSPDTHRNLVWRLAAKAGCRVLCVNYRLAPEHPYPAAVEDAYAVYNWLLAQGFDPGSIAMAGDSAGGGLTFATLAKLRDEGVPLPSCAVGLSPWTDLAVTGPSLRTNARRDPMFDPGAIPRAVDLYLQGADPYDPYASPLYADPTGMPPTLIQVGSTEILLDDSRRLAHNFREAGVDVKLRVYQGVPHVWQVLTPLIPEARSAVNEIGVFLKKHMGAEQAIGQTTAQVTSLADRRRNNMTGRSPSRHGLARGGEPTSTAEG